jgi:hypothetical protein
MPDNTRNAIGQGLAPELRLLGMPASTDEPPPTREEIEREFYRADMDAKDCNLVPDDYAEMGVLA